MSASDRRTMERIRLFMAIGEQRRWIEEHGRDRAGYIARYGETHERAAARARTARPCGPTDLFLSSTPSGLQCGNCLWAGAHGDGGEAIYEADVAELHKLTTAYAENLRIARAMGDPATRS